MRTDTLKPSLWALLPQLLNFVYFFLSIHDIVLNVMVKGTLVFALAIILTLGTALIYHEVSENKKRSLAVTHLFLLEHAKHPNSHSSSADDS